MISSRVIVPTLPPQYSSILLQIISESFSILLSSTFEYFSILLNTPQYCSVLLLNTFQIAFTIYRPVSWSPTAKRLHEQILKNCEIVIIFWLKNDHLLLTLTHMSSCWLGPIHFDPLLSSTFEYFSILLSSNFEYSSILLGSNFEYSSILLNAPKHCSWSLMNSCWLSPIHFDPLTHPTPLTAAIIDSTVFTTRSDCILYF